MEYVIVSFPEQRAVLVDGESSGFTNDIMRLEKGTHTFSLSGPSDYKPDSQTIQVAGTNLVAPGEVSFEKI